MRNVKRTLAWLIMLLALVAGCTDNQAETGSPSVDLVADTLSYTPTSAKIESPTSAPATEATNTPPRPTETSSPSPPTSTPSPSATPTWPAPLSTPFDFAARSPDEREVQTLKVLEESDPPRRKDVQLALWYRGLSALPTPKPPVTETLEIGARQTFSILNVDSNTVSQIEAELGAVGAHAYFWFDLGSTTGATSGPQREQMAAAFDTIYRESVELFGAEANPGIDGDGRIHIVNVSPLALCDVTVDTIGNCGLAGYFSAKDTLPRVVEPVSNEREMFVMNMAHFGTEFYLSVLSHEFRHMIEDNLDQGDADWEVEGSAMLAARLLGHGGREIDWANGFLAEPDRQLTNWSETGTFASYGQAYLFNRFLYDRLGADLYRQLAASPERGFAAIDQLAEESGKAELTGHELWLDWLVALAMPRVGQVPARFELTDNGLNHVAAEMIRPGDILSDTVQQYAADFYAVSTGTSVSVTFRGDQIVSLLAANPASGHSMWLADRANYSDMRLTRTVDLSAVDRATLSYDVFHDLELGYDFAYVAASVDGGATWQGLTAEHMQGLDPLLENPADAAYTSRFYTGDSKGWRHEVIDLTPFAGQSILVRFQYVTDPILTYPGFAIDNISIPEIHFYDAAERVQGGWLAEGFILSTAHIPQRWQLQTITFGADGMPRVGRVPVQQGEATFRLEASQNGRQSMLIVASNTPMTLTPAQYQLDVQP